MIKSILIYEWSRYGKAGCEKDDLWGLRLAYPFSQKPFNKGDILDLNQGHVHLGNYKVECFRNFDGDSTVKAVYVRRVV